MLLRRTLLLSTLAWPSAASLAATPQPIGLRLVRRVGWQEAMTKSRCVVGDLYVTDASFPDGGLGEKVCNVLELAYRNRSNELGSVPRGDYEGTVRTDGARGWRVELKGRAGAQLNERSNVQLHIGGRPSEQVAALLPGTGEADGDRCTIGGAPAALAKLKAALGSTAGRRVLLRVQT